MVTRIAPPASRIDDATPEVPDIATGELATLWCWWSTVSDGRIPVLASPLENRHTASLESGASESGALGAVLAGVAAADAAVDAGATLLLPRAEPRDPRAARIVVALLTRAEPAAVLAQPRGMTDRDWIAECSAIRDGLVDVRDLRGEPLEVLDALSAWGIAHTAGVLLGAAARRTGCLVDGTDESAAALIADRLAFRAKDWWRAGASSPDPARTAAADRIDLPPGLSLGVTDEQQTGARVTVAALTALLDAASA